MSVHHIVPVRTYLIIFGLLMLGTYLTVQAAFLDLGAFNTPIAIAIAIAKATVVVLYFMHVKYSPKLTWIVVIGSVFWLAILLIMTFGDYATRAWRTFG
jgi:cytochrome c oxidase subunit IV